MKKILFIVSLFALFVFPLQTNAGGTVTVGLNCNAYFDWSSTGATGGCGANATSGTDGPHTRSTATSYSKTVTCLNSQGMPASDTATIVWSSSLASCGGGGGGPRYSCSGTSCIADASGPYTTSNCDNMCAQPRYRCSGASCIRDDASGTFTTSNCDNMCVSTPKYLCNGASCVRDDINGTYTTSNCNNMCTGGAGSRYKCNAAACVQDDVNGTFTTSNCNNTCTAPPNCALSGPGSGLVGSPVRITWSKNIPAGYNNSACFFGLTPNQAVYQISSTSPTGGAYNTNALVSGSNQFLAFCDWWDLTYTNKTTVQCPSAWVTGNNCGNGVVNGGEQCDNGASNGACPASCSSSCTTNSCPASISFGLTASMLSSQTINNGQNSSLYWNATNVQSNSCSVKRNVSGTWTNIVSPAPLASSTPLNAYPIGSHQFRMDCNNLSGTPVSSAVATLTVNAVCGDAACTGSETCSSCAADCGVCVNNSVCQLIAVTPSRILTGSSLTGTVNMQNTGGTTWTPPTYTLANTSGVSWGVSTVSLPSSVAGQPTYGVGNFIINATAPATAGTYPFSWRMQQNSTLFGDTCSIAGGVVVAKPQCDDGIDNDGDTKIDCADRECLNSNNTCNRTCDDELNGCGFRISLTANPQIVRNGGRSTLRWDITQGGGSCSITGPNSFSRTGIGDGEGSEIISPINQRQTFYLSCGGLTTKATISVFKVVEPRREDIQTISNTTVAAPVFQNFSASSFYGDGSYDVTWSVTGAEYCIGSDGWSGSKPTSGTETGFSLPVGQQRKHTLTCYNIAGNSTLSVTKTR